MTSTRPILPILFAVALAACSGLGPANYTPPPEPEETAQPAQGAAEGEETAEREFDRSTPPEPGEPRPYEIPPVEEIVLDNGLTVHLIDRPEFPTIAVRLSVRAGRDAAAGNAALSEVVARTLRDGTSEMDAAEIAEYIDRHGISFDTNVETNRVVLSTDGLSTKSAEMLTLLAALVDDAQFEEERLEARKAEYAGEIELEMSKPAFHRDRMVRDVLFGEHEYGTIYPEPSDIEEISRRDVRRFYRATYGPGRARLVIVGDIPDGLEESLERTVAQWEDRAAPYSAPTGVEVSTCNEAHVVVRPDSAQTSIAWVGGAPAMDSDNYMDALVANQVLGGGPSARLFMNLREDKSYTYGAYSRMSHLLGASYFAAMSDVRSEVTEDALVEFELEFDRLRDQEVPADELQAAQNYLAGVFPIELERNSSLAGRISRLYDQGLDVSFLETYRQEVRAVTAEDVEAIAPSLSHRPQLTLVMVGEEDAVVPSARNFASAVYVYDLEGELVDEVNGFLDTNCTD